MLMTCLYAAEALILHGLSNYVQSTFVCRIRLLKVKYTPQTPTLAGKRSTIVSIFTMTVRCVNASSIPIPLRPVLSFR